MFPESGQESEAIPDPSDALTLGLNVTAGLGTLSVEAVVYTKLVGQEITGGTKSVIFATKVHLLTSFELSVACVKKIKACKLLVNVLLLDR